MKRRRKAVSLKGRRVIDDDLLAELRWQPCWFCGTTQRVRQVHHVVSKGMGGWSRSDTRLNCIPLCLECHSAHHAGQRPLTEDLIAVIAARNEVTQADVEDAMREIRWGKT